MDVDLDTVSVRDVMVHSLKSAVPSYLALRKEQLHTSP
jgi:hypothetical protein